MRLALDHLTAVDTTPPELAKDARSAGCDGICVFLRSLDVLPLMPQFDLVASRPERQAFVSRMGDLGLTLELAYPFTLAARTPAEDLVPELDCAAALGARRINVLIYDRDPARRHDRFARLCELAGNRDLAVAVEFFPASQVRKLDEALALVAPLGRPGQVGVNADLLHLMRSGGTLADIAVAPPGSILFGQFADGLLALAQTEWDSEASCNRLLPGEGEFDLPGFAAALPSDCAISVEVPRDDDLRTGVPRPERVRSAVQALHRALAPRANALPR